MKTISILTLLVVSLLVVCFGNPGGAQATKPVSMPQIQTVGEGSVWRRSDNKGQHGNFLPPWKEIQITNLFGFKERPLVGEKITVIPLDVNIPPLELKIVKADKKANACEDGLPAAWEVELQVVREKSFSDAEPAPNRSAEYPFDVCLIYPAVKFVNPIKRENLSSSMLPNGIALSTVKAAIDLTNDGKPDVLIVDYCCGNPNKPAADCDYTCGKTFKKTGNAWKLIDTSSPC